MPSEWWPSGWGMGRWNWVPVTWIVSVETGPGWRAAPSGTFNLVDWAGSPFGRVSLATHGTLEAGARLGPGSVSAVDEGLGWWEGDVSLQSQKERRLIAGALKGGEACGRADEGFVGTVHQKELLGPGGWILGHHAVSVGGSHQVAELLPEDRGEQRDPGRPPHQQEGHTPLEPKSIWDWKRLKESRWSLMGSLVLVDKVAGHQKRFRINFSMYN